jgi:hypothetical protein
MENDGVEPRRDAEPGRVADRADYDPDYDPGAPILCDICGAVMEYTGSCKIACRNCGYLRDCGDP